MKVSEKFNNLSRPLQILIFSSIFLVLFLRADHLKISVEKNVYDYYSESLVSDLDLNLINQVPDKELWQITKTGNWPDVHSNGIVNLWAPFFVYKNAVAKLSGDSSRESIFMIRSMATVFFSVINLLFIYLLLRKILPGKKYFSSFLLLSLGTSYWWFTLFQPGNADLTSGALVTLELWMFFHMLEEKCWKKFLLFGLLIGSGVALKVEHVFYLLLPAWLIVSDFKKSASWIAAFVAGFGFVASLVMVNDSLKFGFMSYGYKDVVNFDYYVLWENLFYPSGFISNCPIYIFCFLSLILVLKSKDLKNKWPVFIAGSIPWIALALESFARIHHESYGGRHWVPHFAVFVILMVILQDQLKTKLLKISFYALACLCIIQNFLKALKMSLDYNAYFYGLDQSQGIKDYLRYEGLSQLFHFSVNQEKVHLALPLALVCGTVFYLFYKSFVSGNKPFAGFVEKLALYLVISYSAITALNYNNNFSAYKKFEATGKLKNSLIGDGPNIQSLFENLGTYEKLLGFYQSRNDSEKVKIIEASRKIYVEKAASEIIYDPAGLKPKLLNDSDHFISNELRFD